MKLIIDISKEKYNQIINKYHKSNVRPKDYEIAIINGTPLPDPHGRIIDESQVTGTFTWDNGYIECYAPTIIEADTESEE